MHLQRGSTYSGRARHFFWSGVLTLFLGASPSLPAGAQSLQFPALVAPPSQEHHVGKVILVELFGWTYRDIHSGTTQYAEASLDGRPVAGLVQRAFPVGERRQPAWLSFFSVNDVDATKTIALQHGAKVLFEPHSFPDRGREAVLADPQGAVFAILASTSGDPPDFLAVPGEWIWSSLITSDPDAGAAFYQTLVDYEVFELPASAGAQHLLLASHNYARASVNSLPAGDPKAQAHWLNYVRVEDTVAAVAKVRALGGRVLVEPWIDRHGGKVAVVADPIGAPFGLLEWPDTESKEVAK
jgi:uncharacterized protein